MSNQEFIQENIQDSVENIESLLDSIYNELTLQGEPSIKGLMLEQEKRGDNIENNLLPKILDELLDIKKTILVAALIIAKTNPSIQEVKNSRKIVDAFCNE